MKICSTMLHFIENFTILQQKTFIFFSEKSLIFSKQKTIEILIFCDENENNFCQYSLFLELNKKFRIIS